MNSWKSTLLSACAPPLSTFIIGTGRMCAASPPRYAPQRLALLGRGGVGGRERDGEDRVGAQARLVRRPVQVDERAIEAGLVDRVAATDGVGDLTVDVGHRAWRRPCPARRRRRRAAPWPRTRPSRRPTGTAARPVDPGAQSEVRLDGRVAPAVEDLAGVDAFDLAHWSPWSGARPAAGARVSRSDEAVGRSESSSQTSPSSAARCAAASTRSRKRPADARSASSGSTRSLRATLTRGEQQVAHLGEPGVLIAALGGGLDLGELLADRGDRRLDALEVEAGGGGAALDLAGKQGPRQVLGDLAEDAGLPARLALLDAIPVAQDLTGALDLDLTEHVGMAADQLLPAVLGDLRQVAGAALLHQQREEVHLEEHVAQLVAQLDVVAALRRVGELVGLLERVRDDRALVLLPVPRALVAQAAGEVVEADERVGDVRAGSSPEPSGRTPTAAWWCPRAPAAAPAACRRTARRRAGRSSGPSWASARCRSSPR